MTFTDVGIIGAGPAGVFTALSIRDFYNVNVTIFDWQNPLTTLFPTGGGRCNFSYFETDIKTFASYYPRGSKFLLSVFLYLFFLLFRKYMRSSFSIHRIAYVANRFP